MTQPAPETVSTESTQTGPTYADAIERASASLMFREPTLARTTKTARAIAARVVDALVDAGITRDTVTKPDVPQPLTLDVTS